MIDKRHDGATVTRRRLLAGVGAVGMASLSGCLTSVLNREESTGPESLEQVRLAALPEDYVGADERTVIPSADIIDTFGLLHHQQVRITRPGKVFKGDFLSAVYTTKNDVEFNNTQTNTLWLSEAGLSRINASAGWYVSVTSRATHTELETKAEARSNSEYVEQVIDADSNLILCAPHGGGIYEYTDGQALRVASETGESAWVAMGYNEGGGAYDRWFVDSAQLHPASFNKLATLVDYDRGDDDLDTYDTGIVFEGTDKRGVYIGGLARDAVKTRVRDAIRTELANAGGGNLPVRIIHSGDLSATDTENIANRVSDEGRHGIQIAQGADVRGKYWMAVADAIISVYNEDGFEN